MSTLTVGAAGAGGAHDYTCDGTADEVQIQAAIDASASGDTVSLSAGTFACAAAMDLAAGVSFVGAGAGDTILQFPTSGTTHHFYVRGQCTVSDFELRGYNGLTLTGSDIIARDLISRQLYYKYAFGIAVPASTTVEHILFDGCQALDTTGNGFMVTGGAATCYLNDVTYQDCRAINCGMRYDGMSWARDWVCGFCPSEEAPNLHLADVTLVDCYTENNYLNGIHIDASAGATNCEMIRCESVGNTRIRETLAGGVGIQIEPGWTATDCIARDNAIGLKAIWSLGDPDPDPTVFVNCQSIDSSYAGFRIARIASVTATGCTISGANDPAYAIQFEDATGSRLTDLSVTDSTGRIVEIDVDGTCSDNVVTYLYPAFAASTAAPVTGETVAFADALTFGDAGWSWDFGDGSGSAAEAPSHVYPSAGVYPVTMTIGGRSVTQTVTVVPGVSYGGARLSEADLAPLDHDPVANATRTKVGRVRLQGSPVSRRTWTIDALADDHAEIDALAALKGQRLILNINGVEYPGVMLRPPMLEVQLTPSAWAYQIGFVQETRR